MNFRYKPYLACFGTYQGLADTQITFSILLLLKNLTKVTLTQANLQLKGAGLSIYDLYYVFGYFYGR